ncbi:MAG: phage tail tape measure protein, partial [Pseudomonadales bacterium]|nr:phage tail tape measure protein [Pseudomonadales bacterium]
MALNNIGLGMTITATNLASGTLRRVSGDIRRTSANSVIASNAMRAGFAVAAAGALTLVSGLTVLKGAMSLARQAGEFEQAIAAVGAIANASVPELESLRDAAIEAGIATQFSPTEATEGLQSLITAGQTATQATETLIPVLDLAAGSLGQLGVAGAAEAVVGTLNSYQLSATEAANVTDRLLRTTQLTNFQARDFETGLAKAAAAGAVFSQDLNDVLITMGLLRNANIDASSSATAFREATRRLGSDQNAQRAVTEAGVQIFDEQTGAMRSIVDVMQELSVATADQTEQERNRTVAQAFGARGLLAFNAIARATFTTTRNNREVTLEGAEAIRALRKELDGATGTAERFRNELLDTFEGQKQLLRGTLQTLGIVLGESFARILKPIVKSIVDTLNTILQFFNDLPPEMKDVISRFILFAGAGLVLFGVFTLIAGVITILLPLLKTMTIVM